MSVVIETTLGDLTVDLFLNERPRACLNFLKLCSIKYYNYNLFHTISRGFIAQSGDPTGSRSGGESIFGTIDGPSKRYFEAENEPRIKHTRPGLISFVGGDDNMIGSQFFITLGEDLTYLDEKHCVFGEVVEGFDVLEIINEVICDNDDRPYQDVRITHTVVLDDPYPNPKGLQVPSRSPSPSAERLQGGRIAPDEEIDEISGKTSKEIAEMQAEREAKARATILEMVGDIPDADIAPPENVLFVCKLNPVTTDDDLEIIFSRFGKIKSCEVIRDRKTGDSLQYAFIEFENQKSCEDAYFKMDNVLIDDRRIHVDFSQSVSKVKWMGKGRVSYFDEKGKRQNHGNRDIGKGDYKIKNGRHKSRSPVKQRSVSPKMKTKSSPRRSRSPRKRSRSPRSHRKTIRKSPKRRTPPRRFRSRSPKENRGRSSYSNREYNRNIDYKKKNERTEVNSRKRSSDYQEKRKRQEKTGHRKKPNYSESESGSDSDHKHKKSKKKSRKSKNHKRSSSSSTSD